jgi:hypothetical protein
MKIWKRCAIPGRYSALTLDELLSAPTEYTRRGVPSHFKLHNSENTRFLAVHINVRKSLGANYDFSGPRTMVMRQNGFPEAECFRYIPFYLVEEFDPLFHYKVDGGHFALCSETYSKLTMPMCTYHLKRTGAWNHCADIQQFYTHFYNFHEDDIKERIRSYQLLFSRARIPLHCPNIGVYLRFERVGTLRIENRNNSDYKHFFEGGKPYIEERHCKRCMAKAYKFAHDRMKSYKENLLNLFFIDHKDVCGIIYEMLSADDLVRWSREFSLNHSYCWGS